MKRIKKYLFVLAAVLSITALYNSNYVFAVDPSLAWNTFLGKNGQHLGYGIAVDSNNNVYTVGLTNTTWNTTLFRDPIGGIGYQGGATDGVVAKLGPNGNVLWYRFIGYYVNDALSAVTVDSIGNVYVVGYMFYGISFSPSSTPSPIHAYNGGDIDAVVMKFDTNGNYLWHTFLGSSSNDYIYTIDLDAAGNIYVGGESYRGWHSSFNNVIGTNKTSDGYQGYIAKLNNDGIYQWHRFLSTYQVYGVAASTNGFLYTVKKGLFYSGGWNYPAEVGKYSATTGAQVWSITLGSGTQDGFGIDLDSVGNVYVRGTGNATWGSPINAYAGGNDVYIAKLNSSGVVQWNTFLGSAGADNCWSSQGCTMSLDSGGNIYVSGNSSATWGSPLGAFAGGSTDGFVATLSNNGSLLWHTFLGGTNSDTLGSLATSASGDIYVAGYTQQTSWGIPVAFPTGCYYCQSVAKISNSLSLTVAKDGPGSGTVTSATSGINCGSTCSVGSGIGSNIVLTATPDAGSIFTGWSGGGCSGSGTCSVTLSANTTVTATFGATSYPLTVSKLGSGSGSVSSSPAGINCGVDCSETYDTGALVTLTATPSTGSSFIGWGGGGGCSGSGSCTVTLNSAFTVTATFNLTSEGFSVIKAGTGSGTVTSVPSGIDCGLDCSEDYDYGTSVTISAMADTDSLFAGWGGGSGCVGTDPCTLEVTDEVSVMATFNLKTFTLNIIKPGGGTGGVVSTPAGITCGADCSEIYNIGTTVNLTAVPASGSTFIGWSGGGCSGFSECVVDIDENTGVAAIFVPTYTLTIAKAGAGAGTVGSVPGGISCGSDCSEVYNTGTSVRLTAVPNGSSIFAGWSGGGCSGTGECVVNVNLNKTITATFVSITYAVTVTKDGTGTGSVASTPAGITCGLDCSQDYNIGSSVRLAAAAGMGSIFAGWGGTGGCSGTGQCELTVNAAKNITATFILNSEGLSVIKSGSGSGTITSSISGINCGSDCSEDYNYGTSVTLTAASAGNSIFAGWSGGGCSGIGTCTTTIEDSTVVTATFNLKSYILTAIKSGGGSGSVTSNISGINCGSDCTENFNYGTSITLSAAAGSNSQFVGWSGGGGCSGTGTCTVTITGNVSVAAAFITSSMHSYQAPTLSTYKLTTAKAGSGTGAISSSPLGINCGMDCMEIYSSAKTLTLTAIPDDGSEFTGWSGGCSGIGECIINVNENKIATATFSLSSVEEEEEDAGEEEGGGDGGENNNAPPIIHDIAGYSMGCAIHQNCNMPSWTVIDDDDEEVVTTWVEVGGSALTITNDGKIDLENSHPPRGVYFLQLHASDTGATTASQTITISIPNNPPVIEDGENISVSGAEKVGDKNILPAFTKNVEIAALFTDHDDDNVAYSWSIQDENAEKVGFISTTSGSSVLRARIAGEIVVTVSADDGNGGIVTEDIIISIPVPEVTEEELELEVSDMEADTEETMAIVGRFKSPVWPITIVNNVTMASVALSDDTPASISKAAIDVESEYDTYTFTASSVPVGTDPSTVNLDIYTEVNGENVFLMNKSIAVNIIDTGNEPAGVDDQGGGDTIGDDTIGDGDDGKGQGGDSGSLAINASVGCNINMPVGDRTNITFILPILIVLVSLLRVRKSY